MPFLPPNQQRQSTEGKRSLVFKATLPLLHKPFYIDTPLSRNRTCNLLIAILTRNSLLPLDHTSDWYTCSSLICNYCVNYYFSCWDIQCTVFKIISNLMSICRHAAACWPRGRIFSGRNYEIKTWYWQWSFDHYLCRLVQRQCHGESQVLWWKHAVNN